MKLGVVGKGGAGKTTVAALLARRWSARGARVVAVDGDSNPGLGLSLGLSPAECEALPCLPRPPADPGLAAPAPEDLVRDYGAATPAGVTLLTAGRVAHAGGGSTCPAHATVRHLLGGELEERAGIDVTIVDMEAGLEHLSRVGGTLGPVDAVVVVFEPNEASVVTAGRALALARELGIPRVHGLGNKAGGPDDEAFLNAAAEAQGIPMVGILPYDAAVAEAERTGALPVPSPALQEAIDRSADRLEWLTVRPSHRPRPAAGPPAPPRRRPGPA